MKNANDRDRRDGRGEESARHLFGALYHLGISIYFSGPLPFCPALVFRGGFA